MRLVRISVALILLGSLCLLPSTLLRAESSKSLLDSSQLTRISAEDLIKLVWQHPDTVVIDARHIADRTYGYIEGSVSLPDTGTDCASLARYIPSMTHPVAIYCNGGSCKRSELALRIALTCGYQHLYWFQGGFVEWKQAGFPYVH